MRQGLADLEIETLVPGLPAFKPWPIPTQRASYGRSPTSRHTC